MRTNTLSALLVVMLLAPGHLQAAQSQAGRVDDGARTELARGWFIQSSARVTARGDEISTSRFQPGGWYPATVPSTVLSALVDNRVYPDPYFGMNLRSIPGTNYPIGANFSNIPTPPDSPFAVPWWYRTQFRLAPSARERRLWLNFDGLNYRANIWLNGHPVATSDQAIGMYRTFEFDVTTAALPGAVNTLAIEVFPPTPTDLSITFVDWNPMPPDKDMGLIRDVTLRTSGPVAVRHTQVITKLDTP